LAFAGAVSGILFAVCDVTMVANQLITHGLWLSSSLVLPFTND